MVAILRGAEDRVWREARMAQAVAYSAAQLVAYAPQKSRDFPKFDRVFPGRKAKAPQSAEEGLRVLAQFARIINRPKGRPT